LCCYVQEVTALKEAVKEWEATAAEAVEVGGVCAS
jgi:hypothetical protein